MVVSIPFPISSLVHGKMVMLARWGVIRMCKRIAWKSIFERSMKTSCILLLVSLQCPQDINTVLEVLKAICRLLALTSSNHPFLHLYLRLFAKTSTCCCLSASTIGYQNATSKKKIKKNKYRAVRDLKVDNTCSRDCTIVILRSSEFVFTEVQSR